MDLQSEFTVEPGPAPSHDPWRRYWQVVAAGAGGTLLTIRRTREIVTDDLSVTHMNPVFPTDAAAILYVMQRATIDGCPDARAVVREIVASWRV